jgi:alanine dehydrogenase
MPGAVARTSTIALTNVTLPWAIRIARHGPDRLAQMDHHFANAINTNRGTLTNQAVAEAHDLEFAPLSA